MKRLGHAPDYTLIILFFGLIVFGLVMLSSTSSVLGYEKFGDSYWFIKHQLLLGILPGLVLFFILSRVDYRLWRKFSPILLFFSIGLLVLVFIPGIGARYGRARSWINIGGLSLQPAEIVKLTFLLYLAAWLEKRRERVHTVAYGFLPFLIYLGLIAGLVILQPDIGTMFIILMISLVIYFVGGARWKHLLLILAGCFAGLVLLVKVAPYRMARLVAFVNPEADPQGIGYHINQALMAIGSGGWFGLGLGNSRQKFQYLPEVAGDSIFAIMAEELGFIFMLALVVVFLIMFYRMVKIANRTADSFGQLLVIGVGTWIVGQAFINIGAMLSLLPLTGLPMPLVSYGGTAMVAAMGGMGIVVNVSRFTKGQRATGNIMVKKRQ